MICQLRIVRNYFILFELIFIKFFLNIVFDYNFSNDEDQTITFIKNESKVLLEKNNFKVLCDKTEFYSLKNRFEENILSLLEDAKRKHESNGASGMPWWGWCLLLYTGYDDVFRLATSYLMIPMLIAGLLIYSLQGSAIFRPVNQAFYVFKGIAVNLLRSKGIKLFIINK